MLPENKEKCVVYTAVYSTFCPPMGKIVWQTRLSSIGRATDLEVKRIQN